MSPAGRRTPGLPNVNTVVQLELPELGKEVASRVEDVPTPAGGGSPPLLLVAAPRVEGSLAWERDGSTVHVRWAEPRGQCLVRCELERRVPGRVPMWQLRAIAAPVRDQRRRYVRAAVPATARLEVHDDAAAAHDVRLCDLSERGARLVLSDAGDEPGCPEVGGDVVLQVRLRDGDVRLPGRVLRTASDPEGQVVVVELDPDEAAAARIRRAVLDAQIEARGLPQR